ncbi:unnamed protein product [Ambrosiozyma monospora]|uniref:Unnamed protein product n=1 Tax=Ambrosiozyma monospora TaxID=43982 RepID=A0A9W6YL03_AMBMO|nr:unnamed protein product [Ambrosiozyma monospora]
MSTYTRNEIRSYAIDAIRNILPLDDESLSQMIDYALNELRSRDAVVQHFKNLIGETPDALDFVTKFSNMKFGDPHAQPSSSSSNRVPRHASPSPQPQSQSKPKSAPKVLKIVSGKKPGQKTKIVSTRLVTKQPTNSNLKVTNHKAAWTTTDSSTNNSSKNNNHSSRLAKNSKSGATTSELLDMKPSTKEKHENEAQATKRKAQKKLNNLKDLEGALTELETLHDSTSDRSVTRVCNCNATRHPLFEMFPNCLNCGKIICIKEGLQPCSFCGKDLLSNEERIQVLTILQKEKDQLEGTKKLLKTNNSSSPGPGGRDKSKKKNKITISINSAGKDNFKIQDQVFKRIERKRELEREKLAEKQKAEEEIELVQKELDYYNSIKGRDDELIKAQERLDTLLNFQDNGAQRTKIIDQASDFDAPTSGNNLWASPLERALQLKRQQKQLRKQEEAEKERTGRGKRVMDLSIRNGKVFVREAAVASDLPENLSDDEEIKELQGKLSQEKMKQFHANTQKVWDHENDGAKWAKPLYVGKGGDKEDDDKENLPVLSSNVVQVGDEEEQENALFGLVGI